MALEGIVISMQQMIPYIPLLETLLMNAIIISLSFKLWKTLGIHIIRTCCEGGSGFCGIAFQSCTASHNENI